MIKTAFVWMNGKLVPFDEAQTHVGAFALHYGVGVFEGIRSYRQPGGGSAVFRLREHLARLHESASIATMTIPFTVEQLEAGCLETLRANRLDEAYVRPLAFTGAGALGMGAQSNPIETVILTWQWGSALGADALTKGVRAQVSSFSRGHVNATMSKGKISGQYVNSVLAKREAQRLGYDEAIMLDTQGRVAEGSGVNIFVVYRGRLLTPPLEMAVLDGITRDTVMLLAREAGIDVVEQTFTRDMLYACSEVFVTGTATEVTPVREIDGRVIGDGKPGPITKRLQDAFFAVVRGGAHPEWRTAV
jgi:branched-chain amino acid aminotransferase